MTKPVEAALLAEWLEATRPYLEQRMEYSSYRCRLCGKNRYILRGDVEGVLQVKPLHELHERDCLVARTQDVLDALEQDALDALEADSD